MLGAELLVGVQFEALLLLEMFLDLELDMPEVWADDDGSADGHWEGGWWGWWDG